MFGWGRSEGMGVWGGGIGCFLVVGGEAETVHAHSTTNFALAVWPVVLNTAY